MSVHQRIQLASCYLLHQRPYRDSSALLEIFSREFGRLGLVARGLRSAKSKWRGELQLFRPLLLSWQSRGDLGTLTGAECASFTGPLSGTALYSAYYLNELLMRLLARHDPHPLLYAAYADALETLGRAGPVESVLRRFEKYLLDELGYGLVFDHDVETGAEVTPRQVYDYRLEAGPVAVPENHPGGFLFSGASLIAMAADEFDDPVVLQDAKRLMRAALKLYLGDKPLKTRELFRQMKS